MAGAKSDLMPIAVIGFGCRFPGGITNGKEFWDLLAEKRSAQSEIPPNRYSVNSFYHPDGDRYGTVSTVFWAINTLCVSDMLSDEQPSWSFPRGGCVSVRRSILLDIAN